MNMLKETKKGQILIIVLVTMMVLGIILISTTSILIKDTQISQSTNKYEELNAYAEKMAFQLGIKYANPQKDNIKISTYASEAEMSEMSSEISDLFRILGLETNNTCGKDTTLDTCYKCDISFDESVSQQYSDEDIDTQLSNPKDMKAIARICDSFNIENAELFKDEILVFSLAGVAKDIVENKTFQISWENNEKLRNIGIEVSIDFTYKARDIENYGTIKSVYKPNNSNLFPLNLNSNNNSYITFSGTGESFNFKLNDLETSLKDNNGYFKHFHDNNIQIINYKQIRVRPILKSDIPIAMKISMKILENPPIRIVQGRSIEVTTYEQSNNIQTETDGGFRGPQASVISTVPAAKFSGLFDYVLKNDNTTTP